VPPVAMHPLAMIAWIALALELAPVQKAAL
jgi:hypothetical protein